MTKKVKSKRFGITEQKGMFNSIVLLHGYFKPSFFDRLKKKKPRKVFVLEGRPSLGSSRYCCKELLKRDVKPTLISDNMAGFLFYKHFVREVWLSYQTKDNDEASCLIGAMILAALCKKHYIPFLLSPSEEKVESMADKEEIFSFNGDRVAPKNIKGYVPLLEMIPKKYITKAY